MTIPQSIIEQVETFIQRCHDLDYVFTEDARRLVVQNDSMSVQKPKLWVNLIADTMTEYTLNKDGPHRLEMAQKCLGMINRAFSAGIVGEGPGLVRRYEAAQKKISEFTAEVESLSKDNSVLEAKVDLLSRGIKV